MNKELKNLPIGIQTFEKIIKGNKLYVDKTELIYKLIDEGEIYFLSRPRRFGKSLLISTFAAIFEGQKELFKGLWIENSNWDWKAYPVIRLDMGSMRFNNIEELEIRLIKKLQALAEYHKVEIDHTNNDPQLAFETLIQALSEKGEKVVVLVDEYDKPLLDNITNMKYALEIRRVLRDFYSTLKSQDKLLKFIFVTGVTRFSKTSIFSGLNNLDDIGMDEKYGSLLGITEAELHHYFKDYLSIMAKKLNIELGELKKEFKKWYNGYMMCEDCEKVYNPFSVLSALSKCKLRNYWFATGTPTFLINLIKERRFDLTMLEKSEAIINDFESATLEKLKVIPLMFQTGYLTITDYDNERRRYKLDFPNYEVKNSLLGALLEEYTPYEHHSHERLDKMFNGFKNNDIKVVIEEMKAYFSAMPYKVFKYPEIIYHSIVYLLLLNCGLMANAEVQSNKGQADIVIESNQYVYIIELKLDQSAAKGMQQIKNKGYHQQYAGLGKNIHLLAINFNSEERNIDDWVYEVVS